MSWTPQEFSFQFDLTPESEKYCAYALQYRVWAQALIERTLTEPTHIGIAQAKVMLLDKYYEWKVTIAKRHGKPHRCISDVLDEAYGVVRAAELALTPPQLYLPQPAAKPRQAKPVIEKPPTRYVSILGELDISDT